MKVFQIKNKSKSPRNNDNNIKKLSFNKNKTSSNNITKRKGNINEIKNKNIFKKIFSKNNIKHRYNYSSNDYSLINTTNFNNSKTNNFIFFESARNYKESELFQQIKSLIKINSSNNFSKSKFINSNNISKSKIHNKKSNKKEETDSRRNFSDKISLNKTNKLSISTNYTLLSKNKNNKKDKKEKTQKLNYIKLSNLHPLTLNFSNEINNFNSFRKLITNQSTKYFNNYRRNNDFKLKSREKISKSSERKKTKSNSTNKKSNNKVLISNKNILKNSKSFNDKFFSYIKSLPKSSSFSPKRKKETKNSDNNLLRKISPKNCCVKKASNNDKKINLQFFNNKRKVNNIFIKNKFSPLSSKMMDMKLYSKKFSYKRIEKLETKNNNSFNKDNTKITKNKKIVIITPEENHFLAVTTLQKIKNYGINFS